MSILSTLKSNKGLVAAGAIVALVGITTTATAKGFGHGRGFPMMRILRQLDLTESQEIQAVKMRRAMREQRKAARSEMQAVMARVKVELAKPDPDPAVLHGAVDEAAEKMKKGMHTAVDQFLVLHKTFTPEQREEMVKIMDRVKERHERRRRRFHGDE